MKKFLPLFLAVVLILVCLAPIAAADNAKVITVNDQGNIK